MPWAFGWFTFAPTWKRAVPFFPFPTHKSSSPGVDRRSVEESKNPKFEKKASSSNPENPGAKQPPCLQPPTRKISWPNNPSPPPSSCLQKVLQELLPAIARRVVQPAVPRAVHGVGVGPAVQQQLHHGDAVGADGVAQRRDALVVLSPPVDILLTQTPFSGRPTPRGNPVW